MRVSFPSSGLISILSSDLFSDFNDNTLDSVIGSLFRVPEVRAVSMDPEDIWTRVEYTGCGADAPGIFGKIQQFLHASGDLCHNDENESAISACRRICRREEQPLHIFRYGKVISTWEIKHEIRGRTRFKSRILYGKEHLCRAIERETADAPGVDSCTSSSFTCAVVVQYSPGRIGREELLRILDRALQNVDSRVVQEDPDLDSVTIKPKAECALHGAGKGGAGIVTRAGHEVSRVRNRAALIPADSGLQVFNDHSDRDFALSTTSLALAAVGQAAFPALLPVSAGLLLYASLPTLSRAWRLVIRERRLGVEVVNAVAISCCLASGQVFAGSLMGWCLSLGRKLLEHTQDTSRKMLSGVSPGEPGFLRVYRRGAVLLIPPADALRQDVVVIESGEIVPVDGIIAEGLGIVDQQILTGDTMPVERGVGDRVYASSILLAGRIYVMMEKAGSETASAAIRRILDKGLNCELRCDARARSFADRAVAPALALGALAAGAVGLPGGLAVIGCDLGTGTRIGAPLRKLAFLNLCAQKGILVKDGRALELMTKVDTVLLDRSAALSRQRPKVARVFTCGEDDENRIIQLAAAAEQRLAHPMAGAVRRRLNRLELPMSRIDASRYHAGQGVTVRDHVGFGITARIDGRLIRVGSTDFIKAEGIAIPAEMEKELDRIYCEGQSLILVAADDRLSGGIELHASLRPEVSELLKSLRWGGIDHLALLSGEGEESTREMARTLGMDRYFAGVMPMDGARYIDLLRAEGRTVCFIGDGMHDSTASRAADVSISLGGASIVDADQAHILYLRENLAGLCELPKIAHDLERSFDRSWKLIVVPSALCVAGVFTLGFGLWHTVLFNTATILLSFLNGMLPMRKVIEAKAEKAFEVELSLVKTANQPVVDLKRLKG